MAPFAVPETSKVRCVVIDYANAIREAMSKAADTQDDLYKLVREAHDVGRLSWTEIAKILGTSRQAAWERFGKNTEPPAP